ncbi:hypothetical protein [Streptomyces sp. NBC_01197]|uniref:hypothetical protein n=1 Tax=Streptomyces sp. NBC_01197 TaxID=2903768 RepID=UPI002E120574|nr:hypothetical protein OG452_21275 [Streptomyces sp. NBC_01197]
MGVSLTVLADVAPDGRDGEAEPDPMDGPGRSLPAEWRGLGGAAGSAGGPGWSCSKAATTPLARTHTVPAAADARTRRLRPAPRAEMYAAGAGAAVRPADSAACFIARARA